MRLSTFAGAVDIGGQAHQIRGTDHKGLWLPDDDLAERDVIEVLAQCSQIVLIHHRLEHRIVSQSSGGFHLLRNP
jgi:hypothetical protein